MDSDLRSSVMVTDEPALSRFELRAGDGRKTIPLCPFAAAYIARHPELAEHVDRALRPRFTSPTAGP